jgi:hypothetical protein
MERELYVNEKETKKALDEKYWELSPIYSFMRDYAQWFKNKESKEALKRIKKYLEKEEKEYEKLKDAHHDAFFKFVDSCKHEIAVTSSPTISDCKCIICGYGLYLEEDKKIPLIIVNIDHNHKLEDELEEKIKEAAYEGKDPVEEVCNYVEDLQFKSNIKVYRRH